LHAKLSLLSAWTWTMVMSTTHSLDSYKQDGHKRINSWELSHHF